jgi:NAD(P)-dependent dehydrogenase (short-subunit alcohol dehydrogenase family)
VNVFITGASSGIGAALARHYAAAGANVGLFARRAPELAAIAAKLPADRVAFWAGDVRDAPALAAAAADFVARFGAPDVVYANAGVSRGTLTEHAADLPAFRAVFETNVLGLVHTFQPFVAPMCAARRGALVGIASVAGFRGLPGSGAYSASKAAAIAYLESLRVELRDSGVAVVTVSPGYVATPMTAKNPYRMPFLVDADKAARLIARAVAARRRHYVLPWPMALVGRLLRWLPRPVYDAAFARAPRKPRQPT